MGGFSGQLFIYDQMGQMVKTSNPTETAVTISGVPIQPYNWAAAGDDAQAGWVYTPQTYDWKGRPLVTTNPSTTGNPADTTTKSASYSGCGCAGGEVVTLTDEGTLVSGVAKQRQQKIYHDVVGRVWKTETLNWDGTGPNGTGGSVYSATVNIYNARDQVTLLRQFQGTAPSDLNDLSCPSGTCQQTTMAFDGYGRLQTKHVPKQQVDPNNSASTDHTTYSYFNDDTINTVKDARGVTTTFGYNSRHLVTSVTYPDAQSLPAGVAPTANVTFGYDAAGNRTSMNDGLGSASYAYDSLSRMKSETRTFSGFGTYTLNYEYNLGGELMSLTDPFNAQVGYNHDNTGRVTSVTGSGFGNVSTYASNFQYRAWGALKDLTYGNYGRTFDATYNARLETTSFIASGLMSLTYQHNDDGRLRYSHDVLDNHFDRSYGYDHAGRMTQALSGPAARGEADNNNRPYTQNYSFDAWNNLTSRTGMHWSHINYFSGTYVNNRMDGWQYDADGRNTVSNTVTSTYDAAGRLIQTSGPQRRNNPPLTLIQGFDGDGRRVKKVEYSETYYSLRSTVLGGAEITEIYGTTNQFFGQKQKGHVYVNGSELAEQNPFLNEAIYKAVDPSGTEQIGEPATQLDPLGNDVGDSNPYLPDDPDPGFSYPHLGDMSDPNGGCVRDGAPWPCTVVMEKGLLRWLTPFLPRLSQLRLPTGPNTPPTFPTSQSQIHLHDVLSDIFAGTPVGSIFFPRADDLWKYITPTFFASPNSGQQLSQCLRDKLRPFFPQMTAQGKTYSPVDDARFQSGLGAFADYASAMTLGLYDILYDPQQVKLENGDLEDLKTIVEEVSHTVQFLKLWASLTQDPYMLKHHEEDTSDYRHAQAAWSNDYVYYAVKGKLRNGDSYKNDVEKWAKNRTFDIIRELTESNIRNGNGLNLCGFNLHGNVTRPVYK